MSKLTLDESKAVQIKEDLEDEEVTPPAPLPDIDMSTNPIEIESGEVVEESGESLPPSVVTNAYASMINNEITAKWQDIDNLNSIIATFTAVDRSDPIPLLTNMVNSATVDIGTLQGILTQLDGTTNDFIEDGIKKAEDLGKNNNGI